MNGVTRRFMRKMRGGTRRVKAPFRSYSFRKSTRGGQPGPPPMGPGKPPPMGPGAPPMGPMGSMGPGAPPMGPGAPPMGSMAPGAPPMGPGVPPMGPAASLVPPQGQTAMSPTYLIKVPAAKTNFDFSKAKSNLPASFGGFVPGGPDDSKFTINLSPKYTPDNLPQFLVTGYVYSSTAGYIQVQRQFGVHAAVAAAGIAIDPAVKKIIFTNITKSNFPYTENDSRGVALYIAFQVLN